MNNFTIYPDPDIKILEKLRKNKTRAELELLGNLPTELGYNKQHQCKLIDNGSDRNGTVYNGKWPFYRESNIKILKESIEQMQKHSEQNVVKALEKLEKLADD